jgi:hypothetical protein
MRPDRASTAPPNVAEAAQRLLRTDTGAAGLEAWQPLRGDERYDPDSADPGPAARLFDEWAALALLGRLDASGSLAPRLVGGDRTAGVLVMEEVRPGEGLDRLLLGGDGDAAARAVRGCAETLGRLHARTTGCGAEHAALRAALGPVPPTPVSTAAEAPLDADGLTSAWRRAAQALHLPPGRGVEEDVAAVAAFWAAPDAPRALVHADACPDNCLATPDGVRLLDFEFAGFRHPLVDGASVRLGFPSCWCAGTVPAAVLAAAEAAYRTALGGAHPWAADDRAFDRALVEACGYWTLGAFVWAIPGLLDEDVDWGLAGGRRRLLHRMGLFAELAERRGHLRALGASVSAARARLAARWPEDRGPPGLFAAFR